MEALGSSKISYLSMSSICLRYWPGSADSWLDTGELGDVPMGSTPVVTGSIRKYMWAEGIEALRGAYDGGTEAWGAGVPPTPGVLQKEAGFA